MGYIYIIRSTQTEKVYIGQTIGPINKRWSAHKKCARMILKVRAGTHLFDVESPNYRQVKNSKLYNAMADLGIDTFSIEILIEIGNDQLNDIEKENVLRYNSRTPNGFNMTSGGGSQYGHSEETIFMLKLIKLANIDKTRHKILHGMPVHFTYHERLQAFLLQRHPLCPFKTFSFKTHGSVELAREAAIKFVKDLEDSDTPYEKVKKMGDDLPNGIFKQESIEGGYRVQKQINNKTYRKDFTELSPEDNKIAAIMYAEELVQLAEKGELEDPVRRVKARAELPAGIIAIAGGYKVQKQINNVSYRKKFVSTKPDVDNLQRALTYYNEIMKNNPK